MNFATRYICRQMASDLVAKLASSNRSTLNLQYSQKNHFILSSYIIEIDFYIFIYISVTLKKRVLLEKWIILTVYTLSAAYQKLRRDIVDRPTLHLPGFRYIYNHSLVCITKIKIVSGLDCSVFSKEILSVAQCS